MLFMDQDTCSKNTDDTITQPALYCSSALFTAVVLPEVVGLLILISVLIINMSELFPPHIDFNESFHLKLFHLSHLRLFKTFISEL